MKFCVLSNEHGSTHEHFNNIILKFTEVIPDFNPKFVVTNFNQAIHHNISIECILAHNQGADITYHKCNGEKLSIQEVYMCTTALQKRIQYDCYCSVDPVLVLKCSYHSTE